MITAKDVADRLGVSISTVGRAIANDPRISDETKAKVRKAADSLGYVGSNPARVIRGGSSKLVGLLIPDVGNDFYGSVAQTLSTCLDRQSYGLVLSLTEDDREREMRQIRELVGARAAGVILVPTPSPKREVRAMLADTAHIQFLRRVPSLGDVWFGIDDAPALQAATEHLLRHGHRRIAYIGGTEQLSTGTARVGGYRTALAQAGIAQDDRLEWLGDPTADFGQTAAAALLSMDAPPTAVVAGSVHVTLGLIRHLEIAAIDTPARLSLIGFGDAPWFAWWRGGLTAIQPPVRDLATSCALWLLDHLRDPKDKSFGPHAAVAHSTLSVRRSVSSPPASSKR